MQFGWIWSEPAVGAWPGEIVDTGDSLYQEIHPECAWRTRSRDDDWSARAQQKVSLEVIVGWTLSSMPVVKKVAVQCGYSPMQWASLQITSMSTPAPMVWRKIRPIQSEASSSVLGSMPIHSRILTLGGSETVGRSTIARAIWKQSVYRCFVQCLYCMLTAKPLTLTSWARKCSWSNSKPILIGSKSRRTRTRMTQVLNQIPTVIY